MFPPPPASHVDWAQLSLANQPTVNGHVEARFKASTQTWTEPEFVKDPHIRVHGLSPGLNYGQQAYEGLKAFRTPSNNIHVFRPDFHATRLAHSASFVSMPSPPEELFKECLRLAIVRNAEYVPPADPAVGGFLYVRPVLFGSSAQLALMPPDEYVFAVYVAPARPYHGSAALDALVLEDFDRAAPHGTGSAKLGGNYAPVWQHQMRAKEMGFGITLHLDSATRTMVEEFSTSGFLGIGIDNEKSEDGDHTDRTKTLWVPETPNAIRSATSDSIVVLAEQEGWRVEKTEIPFSSLSTMSEVFAVGTAASAVPIRSITRKSTKERLEFPGTSGPLAKESNGMALARRLSDIQYGLAPDRFEWCWEIESFPVGHVLSADPLDHRSFIRWLLGSMMFLWLMHVIADFVFHPRIL